MFINCFNNKYRSIYHYIAQVAFFNGIGSLALASFTLIDSYFISLLGFKYLHAVNFSHPIVFIFLSLISAFSSAFAINFSGLLGKGKHEQARLFLVCTGLSVFTLSCFIAILTYINIECFFALFVKSADSLAIIDSYLSVWILGLPFLAGVVVLQSALRSIGKIKLNAFFIIFSVVLNFILDPILIFGVGNFEGLGVAGAAYASLLSWLISFCCIIGIFCQLNYFHVKSFVKVKLVDLLFNLKLVSSTFAPIACSLLVNPVSNFFVLLYLSGFGEHAVAAYNIGTKIQLFFITISVSISASIMPHISFNLSSGNLYQSRNLVKAAVKFILLSQLLCFLLLRFFAWDIAGLFGSNQDFMDHLYFYVYWCSFGFIPLSLIILLGNSLIACGKSKLVMFLNAFRSLLLLLPIMNLSGFFYGERGAFLAPVLVNTIMSLYFYYMFRSLSIDSEGVKVNI